MSKVLLILLLGSTILSYSQNLSINFIEKTNENGFSIDNISTNIYSNPDNIFTHFITSDTTNVQIKIYNENDSIMIGKEYLDLYPGKYELNWNYKDQNNKKVIPGEYTLEFIAVTKGKNYYQSKIIFIAVPSPFILEDNFIIKPSNRTKIFLYDENNSLNYCLFDNRLEKEYLVKFIYCDYYNKIEVDKPNVIKIPIPKLDNGLYFINYKSEDTTYTKKFFLIK